MSDQAEVVVVTSTGIPVLPASVIDAVASFGAVALPGPVLGDPSAGLFWRLTVPGAAAAALVARLLELPEVDGAYVKPSDAAP